MDNDAVPYLMWTKGNILKRLDKQVNNGMYFLRQDGKIDYPRKMAVNVPWIYVRHMPGLNCHLWHHIMFDVLFQEKMVPIQCHECWKVVVAPKNLADLFKLLDLMERLQYPSKCGIEGNRANTNKLYGGYFYTRSLAAGRARYKEVRAHVDEVLGEDTPVILKRACTEYEQACGPSDKWEITPEQVEMERIIYDRVVDEIADLRQSEHQKEYIKVSWIHAAYQWGDNSYQEFTGGNPLFRNLVTYHDQENENGENKTNG